MRFSQMCRGRRGHLHLGALAFQDIAHFAFKGAITAGTGFDFVVGHGEMFRIERRDGVLGGSWIKRGSAGTLRKSGVITDGDHFMDCANESVSSIQSVKICDSSLSVRNSYQESRFQAGPSVQSF